MQHLLTDADWDALEPRPRARAAGELGKNANCQAVVTAEYIAEERAVSVKPMPWPLEGARLLLTNEWATDSASSSTLAQ